MLLEKGKYTLATIRAEFAGKTLLYQLTEPIVTENVTSGTLISYPGGTVYAEPALADAGVYDSGITVLNAVSNKNA